MPNLLKDTVNKSSNSVRISLPRRGQTVRASTTKSAQTDATKRVERETSRRESELTGLEPSLPSTSSSSGATQIIRRVESSQSNSAVARPSLLTPRVQPPVEEENLSGLPLVLASGAKYKYYGSKITEKKYRNQTGSKGKDFFIVGAILEARKVEDSDTEREFLIKWKGYPNEENSWEPEANLTGCVLKLNGFCTLNKIRATSIDYKVGGSSGDNHNEKNFVNLSTIQKRIRREVSKNGIPVEVFKAQKIVEDSILLISHDCHCYVALMLVKERLLIIADGMDWYHEDAGMHEIDEELIEFKKISASYGRQLGVDDCGASAVMIAIDLIRRYRKGNQTLADWQKPISVCASTLNRVTEEMRVERSERVNKGATMVNNWTKRRWLSCECGWSSNKTGGQALNAHKKFQCPLNK